jgi:hypothetical protein
MRYGLEPVGSGRNIESFEWGILRDSRSPSKLNLPLFGAAITARAILNLGPRESA